jgi:hypothetical protein
MQFESFLGFESPLLIRPLKESLKPFALSLSKGQSFGSFDKLSPNGVETSWGRINK